MHKEKRRLHQKMIHKLMHKVGGRFSSAWDEERRRIHRKVQTMIIHQKVTAIQKKQKLAQQKALESAAVEAVRSM